MAERLDRFMARANAAYYATRDPFRDFTTAPEISQVFGELLGGWAAMVWLQAGRPDPVWLAEAGPGRGTLMRDALRVARRLPDFARALRPVSIETSPRLREAQRALVPDLAFCAALEALPPGPAILLANEFLDALPIRQFVRRDGVWTERYVEAGAFMERPTAVPLGPAPDGAVLEHGEAALGWVAALAARIREEGGAALLLDYGEAGGGGDTLQALRGGKAADPLAAPGEADLTAQVDFGAILEAVRAAGAQGWGPVRQGDFLDRLGLQPRTEALARANPAQETSLREAADRLANPARMGALFKAVAITAPGSPAPPGFEP